MNAFVAFQTNTTGARNITPAQRAEAARDVGATFRAKAAAYLTKAGLISKSALTTPEAGQTLDRDTFLQLLVLQMQHQDPLEPIDNTEMIAQLAQFTSLEQMQQMNESFEALSGNISQLNFMTAGTLIGREVSGTDADGQFLEGAVRKIVFEEGQAYLVLDNGNIPIGNAIGIGQTPEEK